MNITLYILLLMLFSGLTFGVIFFFIMGVLRSDDKIRYFIYSIICLLMLFNIIYSTLNYLGKIEYPIKQGVFRQPIHKNYTREEYHKPPVLYKNLTDEQLYDKTVEKISH